MKMILSVFLFIFLINRAKAQEGNLYVPKPDSSVAKQINKVDTVNYDRFFVKVDKEAAFPGGAKGWSRFLEEHLDPMAAERENLKPGQYPIDINFIIDKNGNVSDVHAIEKAGKCTNCIKEVLRLFKKSPKWIPAVLNGHNVKYVANQRITFAVSNE